MAQPQSHAGLLDRRVRFFRCVHAHLGDVVAGGLSRAGQGDERRRRRGVGDESVERFRQTRRPGAASRRRPPRARSRSATSARASRSGRSPPSASRRGSRARTRLCRNTRGTPGAASASRSVQRGGSSRRGSPRAVRAPRAQPSGTPPQSIRAPPMGRPRSARPRQGSRPSGRPPRGPPLGMPPDPCRAGRRSARCRDRSPGQSSSRIESTATDLRTWRGPAAEGRRGASNPRKVETVANAAAQCACGEVGVVDVEVVVSATRRALGAGGDIGLVERGVKGEYAPSRQPDCGGQRNAPSASRTHE